MNTYILVFDDGSDPAVDLQGFTDRLDDGAQVYTLDGHACFVRSWLDAAMLTDRFLPFAGSRLFFFTAVSPSDYSGRMVGPFWDFLKRQDAELTAA